MSEEIFDVIRKKYVALTPEEKVRQHIISILIKDKNIPLSLIAVEAQIKVGKLMFSIIYKLGGVNDYEANERSGTVSGNSRKFAAGQ